MLGVFEKITWVLTVIVILACGGWVGYFGLPSTTPAIAMGSKKISESELKLPKEVKANVDAQKAGMDLTDAGWVPRAGGKRNRTTTVYQVDKDLEKRLGNLNDCMSELKFASSEVQPDGTLKVFDIKEGSLLQKVGLQNNDILERVGGLEIDFSSVPECHSAWQESLERMKSGTPIVIELKRNGQVQQLIVSPEF